MSELIPTAPVSPASDETSAKPSTSLPLVDDRPQLHDNAVKLQRLQQNLATIQLRLRPMQRSFSKFVHIAAVNKVSEVAAKTITRPAGLLGGGITAFAASLLYLYLAHHVGFSYNYVLFLLFFGAGFGLGVAGEYAIYWSKRFSSR